MRAIAALANENLEPSRTLRETVHEIAHGCVSFHCARCMRAVVDLLRVSHRESESDDEDSPV